MREFIIDLNIPYETFEKHYSGAANTVNGVSREGLRVQFPTNILQRFVSQQGVIGTFAIEFDDNYKFKSIRRLTPY